MSAPFVAEIRIFACNFPPKGWALCNGQILPISQNTALFSLLGTMYGGDGKSTFALPDMQGNVAIGQGQGPGLSPRFIGEEGGSQTITLLQTEMPVHTHNVMASNEDGTQGSLTQGITIANSVGGQLYQTNTNTNLVNFNFQAVSITGGGLPHNNMQPYLVLNFCIALQGVFPARP